MDSVGSVETEKTQFVIISSKYEVLEQDGAVI